MMSKTQGTVSSYLLHCPQPSKMVPPVATWEQHIQLCIFTFLPPGNKVWCKVMFLLVPVILFTGGGGGRWLPSMHHRSHAQHPRRVCLQGGLPTGSLATGGSVYRGLYTGVLPTGGLHPGGSANRGVCIGGIGQTHHQN